VSGSFGATMMQPAPVALEVSRDELGERLSAVRLVPRPAMRRWRSRFVATGS